MTNLADALKAERPGFTGRPRIEAPLGDKRGSPKQAFTMQRLRRLAVWGAAAAAAVLAVALTSRSDIALERLAFVLHRPRPVTAPAFDAREATAQLADAVRGLKVSDEQLQTRLAAVEHDMDVTGSITRQIQVAAASRQAEQGPSLAATALASASIAPVDMAPPPAVAPASAPAPLKTDPNIALPPLPKTAFGVDIGSGLNLQALRMRWAAIRTAHPKFFEGMEPIISVREVPHSNRIELRLIAGPIPQPGPAAELCARLTALGLYCQPTIYDGQHLALR
ncbi:MAG TPA: hypothetical protein VL048_02090 [Xanthobacteraceae bacterium]|nr:hypothetical protein [Xanthobacteraceae bacterium]